MNFEVDPEKRFSSRVENYKKYRPGYPKELIEFFKSKLKLKAENIIADIGSGTGILTEMFLNNGNTVYAVEPNKEMRESADKTLINYRNFISINGSSENTNLKSNQIDFITAAQSFHWFKVEETKKEFSRILKDNGWVVLIWNTRKNDASQFMEAYEKFLLEYSIDYGKVSHTNISDEILKKFYSDYGQINFPNLQVFNFEELKGRVLSSSYMPSENHAGFNRTIEVLYSIFSKFNENNVVKFIYDTEVYYGKLK